MNQSSDDFIAEFTAGQGALIALVSAVIFFVFAYFGDDGRARTVLVSTGTLLTAFRIFWPLRIRIWFWIAMTGIAAAHLVAILQFPLDGDSYSGFRIAPIILIDIVVVIIVINLLAKAIEKK